MTSHYYCRKVEFLAFLAPIYLIFQIFCLAPPLIHEGVFKKYMFKFFACVTITSALAQTFVALRNFKSLQLPQDVSNFAVIIVIMIAYNISTLESVFTTASHTTIVKKMFGFDCEFAEQLIGEGAVSSEQYQRQSSRYAFKVFATFTGILGCYITGCNLHYIEGGRGFYVVISIIAYTKISLHTKLIQCGFYMDMIIDRLYMINGTLESMQQQIDENETIGKLEIIQNLYAKLREITCEINLSFGWSLMAIVIENIFDLVNDCNIFYYNAITKNSAFVNIGIV